MTLRHLISPEDRRKKLKEALEKRKFIRGIEVHNALSALIANDLRVEAESGYSKDIREFDFFWESSLTDSASKGHPDIELVSFDSRLKTIREILEVTDKPIIVDGDTGGDIHHFEYLIPKLESIGVSAVIIEDKVFPKRNSLEFGAIQIQEEPEKFCQKISAGKNIQQSKDFMIIARIESLIAEKDVDDAINRARCYLIGGVDGIMIHSKSKEPAEILEFSERYRELCRELNLKKPLICVPTTYNSIYESELEENGFNIVIYANHMLRASYKAMQEVGEIILKNGRSLEADSHICSVREVFDIVGFSDITAKDKLLNICPSVIVLAAGETKELRRIIGDIPKALIKINDKTLLEHQVSLFKKFGLQDINVVVGYQKELFNLPNLTYIPNNEYSSKGILHSLMLAQEKMKNGFIYINGDILFDERLIKEILERKEDMVIIADNSYFYHKHEVDKELDAIISKKGKRPSYQRLRDLDDELLFIGKKIPKEIMTHEFVGIAKFSKKGADALVSLYNALKKSHFGQIQESDS